LARPYLKISITKGAGGVAQGEDSEFKPQYHPKKKKKSGFGHRLKFPHYIVLFFSLDTIILVDHV
jgi:hypothetical protein